MRNQTFSKLLWRDKQLGAAILAALIVWAGMLIWFPPQRTVWPTENLERFLLLVLAYPIIEEVVFRGLLQGWLLTFKWGQKRWWLLSGANLITTAIFAAMHGFQHAPIAAAMVIFPSLVFGYFRDRDGNIGRAIFLHSFYNAGYFLIYGVG